MFRYELEIQKWNHVLYYNLDNGNARREKQLSCPSKQKNQAIFLVSFPYE